MANGSLFIDIRTYRLRVALGVYLIVIVSHAGGLRHLLPFETGEVLLSII